MRHQNSSIVNQYPGRYRHDLLVYLMREAGHTPRTAAKKAKKSKTTIAEALVGECKKLETLWDITKALGGKWEYLFKLDLEEHEFRRAVLNGDSESV